MESQPKLASRSKLFLIYKCPIKNFGALTQNLLNKKHQILDNFSRDFGTRHCISPERNVASTNKNANANLQCVPYKLTYFP